MSGEKDCEVCCWPTRDPLDFWITPDGVERAVCLPCQGLFDEFDHGERTAWLAKRGWLPRER